MLDLKNENVNISQPVFGRYDLVSELGRGRHGVVYKATDMKTGGTVAVKTISLPNDEMLDFAKDHYGNDFEQIANFVGDIAEKFGNEVASMMEVKNSASVITLYDNQLSQDGYRYDIVIVMEYAIPMKKYFREHNLTVKGFIDFACQIAGGLVQCERAGIIHRDIKEDNLFIGLDDNHAKIGDFGVASISETGLGSTVGMGTPYYMAPEVSKGARYDNSADIYSLGIVLYKMLNGNRFPLAGEGIDAAKLALEQRMAGAPVPIPRFANPELGRIVQKCCEYYPQDRYTSAEELCNDLYSLLRYMSEAELNKVLPYLYDPGKPIGEEPINDYGNDNNSNNRDNNSNNVGNERNDNNGIDYNYRNNSQGNGSENNVGGDYEKPNEYKTIGLDELNKNGQVSGDVIPERNKKESDGSWLEKTRDILMGIKDEFGRNSTVAVVFDGVIKLLSKKESDAKREKIKKKQKRNAIILISMILAMLVVLLVLLYPKTATFYVDTADDDRIHVRYLFLPDRRLDDDIYASYLNIDGNWLYYSDPTEDHSLYKKSIWYGDPVLLCEDDCEYDVVIGDYIYFTSYDEGEHLYRIKKDGTGKQKILPYQCRDLKQNGNNLMFVLVETGELKEIDTTTIK